MSPSQFSLLSFRHTQHPLFVIIQQFQVTFTPKLHSLAPTATCSSFSVLSFNIWHRRSPSFIAVIGGVVLAFPTLLSPLFSQALHHGDAASYIDVNSARICIPTATTHLRQNLPLPCSLSFWSLCPPSPPSHPLYYHFHLCVCVCKKQLYMAICYFSV